MPSFSEFLLQIQNIDNINAIPYRKDLVEYDNYVYIGCGNSPAKGLLLNNKVNEMKYSSVTRLVLDMPDDILDNWVVWHQRPLTPVQTLEKIVLVVEDASPDSILTLFILLAKLNGVDSSEIPAKWLAAIDNWEKIGNAFNPETSWCALSSSLIHARFPKNHPIDDTIYRTTWKDALRFLSECISENHNPENLPSMFHLEQWRAANAALKQERLAYLDWLTHATIVQVSLPLSHGLRRRLLDALIFVEDEATGAAKTYYRNDRENSPMGEGFGFAAHYRPTAKPGDNITISVDPFTGTNLYELWTELEHLESLAWQAAGEIRPTDDPRLVNTIIGNTFNEPWFINLDKTLIAAPRELSEGRPGSKLSWNDVREAIWRVYYPLQDAMVHTIPGSSILVPLNNLRYESISDTGQDNTYSKRFLIAHWPHGNSSRVTTYALSNAPITYRILAGMIQNNPNEHHSLDDLPNPDTWQFISLSGGFALVTGKGLFVLDDWSQNKLNIQAIRDTFNSAAILDNKLRALNIEQLKPLLERVSIILRKKGNRSGISEALYEASMVRTTLAELRGNHVIPPEDIDACAIKNALENRWALVQRLAAIDSEAQALENSMRTLIELGTNQINRWIGVQGFALVVALGLAEPVAKFSEKIMKVSNGQADAFGEHILISATAIFIFLLSVFSAWKRREDPIIKNKRISQSRTDDG